LHRFTPTADVLADAGSDSEPNHRYGRECHGVRSFIPATAGRPTAKLPSGRHPRRVRLRLHKNYGSYGQRWQIETVNSMIKRRLAAHVAPRTYWSQSRELMLLIMTHNTMILLCLVGFSSCRRENRKRPFGWDDREKELRFQFSFRGRENRRQEEQRQFILRGREQNVFAKRRKINELKSNS
jgi:hypothetical protein